MYEIFDSLRLGIQPLANREHELDMSVVMPLVPKPLRRDQLSAVAGQILKAKRNKASVVLMMGAHVIRSGVQRYLIDLMEKGLISCIATNGACVIHDYEFSLIGKTTESVAKYIKDGRFGFWHETGQINTIVNQAAKEGLGLGEAIGKAIEEQGLQNKDISIFAAAYRMRIPMTVHVGIGYDITHQHPNCNGAAYGATSYTDFLRFARVLESLDRGVLMNFGSSVMGPEVFLKALSMVRNIARQKGESICRFTTLVCDLYPLPGNIAQEASKQDAAYFFRPWKTLLVRTVASGGKSYYVRGNHKDTIPELWTAIKEAESSKLTAQR